MIFRLKVHFDSMWKNRQLRLFCKVEFMNRYWNFGSVCNFMTTPSSLCFFQVHYWLLSHSHEKETFWLWHGIKQKVGLSMTSISKLLEREKEGFTEEKGSLRHKWQRLDFDKSRKTNKITFQFLTCHLLLLVTKDSLQSNVFAYGQP